jgi:UDP-3-O-[3-hydroxymyristoyl] glucosamine N-acyltransferase
VTEGGQYGGNPLQPLHEFNKHRVYIRNIEKYVKRIEQLEKKLQALEELVHSNKP